MLHRDVLSYMLQFIDHNDLIVMKDKTDNSHITYFAKCGYINLIKYIRSMGFDTSNIIKYAAKYGHLEVIQFAFANNYNMSIYGNIIGSILVNEANDWISVKCYDDHPAHIYAAKYGHVEILQWAKDNEMTEKFNLCNIAAAYGHLNMLQWARNNGYEWYVDVCHHAAENGHLDILQWARANGCPWDSWTSVCAAECGQLDILQWVLANGCEYNSLAFIRAEYGPYSDVIQWLLDNGYSK